MPTVSLPDNGRPSNAPSAQPCLQSSTSPANAFYSPHTGTPFNPPLVVPPGTYYMLNVPLPDNARPSSNAPSTHPPCPQHPPGVSADWIGPPINFPSTHPPPWPQHLPGVSAGWIGPPSNAPSSRPPWPQHPPGISADWIGPPTEQQPTGFSTPPSGLVPSPWSAAMSTPYAAFGTFAPALPPMSLDPSPHGSFLL